ncbi:CpaF family protein [Colwellia sp. MB3u-4]|uniref:CpaF family protein n=1 Tax=Colwellia sp. MB3u-4 TaxID=2759822 RepID=UPI0015F49A07|nr:CpaF family protein [Colwellia sp. MB3u-4]MBA6289260.1 CpaF family protein [Colwellia sp. MB3u-4]
MTQSKNFSYTEPSYSQARDTGRLRELRHFLHNRLIDAMEEEGIHLLKDPQLLEQKLNELIADIRPKLNPALSSDEKNLIRQQIMQELTGMGPISDLMNETDITDILINGPDEIWVDKNGRLTRTNLQFDNERHLRLFLDRILGVQGRQLDARQPMVDARLPDGSRLHAIIPPLCEIGPIVSIRRFHSEKLTAGQLVNKGFLNQKMMDFLQLSVAAGINIVIAGSASAGKTTLLNVISGFIPSSERIVTVEETAELQLNHPHVIPLESRHVNSEGYGAVTLSDLVRNALRMRADRIVVGEVRGIEVLDMLQAMNVGHDGSLTTLHANSPKDVISRMETLALMGDSGFSRGAIQQMIAASIQLIVQVMRFRDGSRRIVSISELVRHDDSNEIRELFTFRHDSNNTLDTISGKHISLGKPTELANKVAAKGYTSKQFNDLLQAESLC